MGKISYDDKLCMQTLRAFWPMVDILSTWCELGGCT